MRCAVAALLLLLRLQSLAGVALCSRMGGGDEERMEAGCPMPETSTPAAPRGEGWTPLSAPHDCVFAEACAPSAIIVHSASTAIVSLPQHVEPAGLLGRPLLPTEGRAPPVPPPKA